MKVITAKPAGDIDNLADEIQAGQVFRLHRACVQPVGVNTAKRDLGRAVPFGPGRAQRPVFQLLGQGAQPCVRIIGKVAGDLPCLGQIGRQPRWQKLCQHGRGILGPGPPPQVFQGLQTVLTRQQVNEYLVALAPKAGDLQDRRTRQAAMREQQRLVETRAVGRGPRCGRDP